MTAKDAWRQLRKETSITVGYPGFTRWVRKLAIELNPGIDTDALATLRKYAEVKAEVPSWRTHQNGLAKVEVLRAIAKRRTWMGSELVDLVEYHGATSRATLYRRAKAVLGGDFSTRQEYTAEQARKLIFGV